MIICHSKKLVFIHIYKTGGTSITKILAPYTSEETGDSDPRVTDMGFQANFHYDYQHSKYSQSIAKMPNNLKDRIKDYTVLTVVRNPYSWFYSIYLEFFSKEYKEIDYNELFGKKYPHRSLTDFLEFLKAYNSSYAKSHVIGFSTQSAFLKGVNPSKLKMVKFERYAKKLNKALAEIGIDCKVIPHELNWGKTKKKKILSFANDPEYIRFVNDYLHEDFENFKYRKEKPGILLKCKSMISLSL